jgi:hypothetical protein
VASYGSTRQSSFMRDPGLSNSGIGRFIDEPRSAAAQDDALAFTTKRGWWGAALDHRKMARLESALGALQLAGMLLVVILPPLMPHIAVALEERLELVFSGIGDKA